MDGKLIRTAVIKPEMSEKEVREKAAYLVGTEKICVECGGVNTMWDFPECHECALKKSKCNECGKRCHDDLGGIYPKCKKCLDKEVVKN